MNDTVPTKKQNMTKHFLERLEDAAGSSLTDEVGATPKPGLVDRNDSGAHRDMDYGTFEVSIRAILPFFKEMARLGTSWEHKAGCEASLNTAESLFHAIRSLGVRAEKSMFDATGGVNTHKGIIFSMGLAAAAAGFFFRIRYLCEQTHRDRDFPSCIKAEDILLFSGMMCKTSMEHDFSRISSDNPKTHGELLYLKYGCRGIRQEAADGFPAVRLYGLPALREFQNRHPEIPADVFLSTHPLKEPMGQMQNQLSLHILLSLMASVDDTNVLFRTDYASLEYVKKCASAILTLGGGSTTEGMNALTLLNTDFIERNISPGGCADLLSMTLFVRRLELIFAVFDNCNP